MSTLQQAIEANTAAIRELTVILTLQNKGAVHATIAAQTVTQPTYHEQRAAAAEENLNAEPAPALSYDTDVKPWAIKLAAKDKQALLDTLTLFGVKKGSDVADQAALLAHIKVALGE